MSGLSNLPPNYVNWPWLNWGIWCLHTWLPRGLGAFHLASWGCLQAWGSSPSCQISPQGLALELSNIRKMFIRLFDTPWRLNSNNNNHKVKAFQKWPQNSSSPRILGDRAHFIVYKISSFVIFEAAKKETLFQRKVVTVSTGKRVGLQFEYLKKIIFFPSFSWKKLEIHIFL